MNRHEMFIKRLREIGMYDADSDYDGMIGGAVERMSKVFADEGHSGVSAAVTCGLWNKLMDEYNNPESVMWKPVPDSPEGG